jgi:NTE family protein
LQSQPGAVFDVAKAEHDITTLAASGDYERTDYRLVHTRDGQEGLIFDLKDKSWGPDYLQMGLDFNADTHGHSEFNIKLVHNRHWLDDAGTEWRNFLRIGSAPAFGTELYRPTNWRLPDGLSGFVSGAFMIERRLLDYYQNPDQLQSASVDRRITTYNLDAGVNWRELGEWRLGLVDEAWRDATLLESADYTNTRLATLQGDASVVRWREQGWRIRGVFDQLDHAYFPTQGWRVEGNWMEGHTLARGDATLPEGPVRHLELQGQAVQTWGVHSFNVYGRLGLSDGVSSQVPRYGLGGFQQLSGYGLFQVSGQQVALLRLGYYTRLTDMALTRGLFFGSSVEAGNAWEHAQEVWRGKKRLGGSVYLGGDTAFGPVYLAIVESPYIGPALMFFVGRP